MVISHYQLIFIMAKFNLTVVDLSLQTITFMKKHTILILALIFAASTWTQAQTVLDFKLVNNTGEDFYAVYLTDSDTEEWGEDILPEDIVEAGDVIDISFDYIDNETICEWDLKLTHDESEEKWIYIKEIDLCDIKILTLYIDEEGEYAFTVE